MTYSECAKQYIGIKEGSKQHKALVDYYNSNIKPLPRSYRVKYTDSWCAVFVSVILDKCKAISAPYECSCAKMLQLAKQKKQITATPDIDHIIFYDWGNDGSVNHVGIISGIGHTHYYVIEGNYSNSVKVRTIRKDSKEIEGFCYPNRQIRDSAVTDDSDLITALALDVIRGKYGTGQTRKTLLGDKYQQVQAKVNELLKSKK